MKSHNTELRFVICIKNEDCEDLELRKIYQVLSDEAAAEDNYLRIIDESGEDYLYPADYFVEIQLPQAVEKAVLRSIS
ncbi:hypothetical protein FJZ31_13380 [Candidatus Poribacteria bacterium]|nr:hypothetical protein [Candidatus Poribacteria bacterium]